MSQTRIQIINELYRDKHIRVNIRKHTSRLHLDAEKELRSIIFLDICEMDEQKLIELYDKGELRALIFHKIRSHATGTGHALRKSINSLGLTEVPASLRDKNLRVPNEVKIDDEIVYLPETLCDTSNTESHMAVEDIRKAISTLSWFEQSVIDLYIKYGSISKICRQVGTSEPYINQTLKEARRKIKEYLGKNI
jgi:hypothetical protein